MVGHSFGGLIAQELLANGYADRRRRHRPGADQRREDPAVLAAAIRVPVLGNPANKKRTVSLTAKQFRYSFGNAITEQESDALHEAWTIPGPGRPLFEDATANFTRNSRPPSTPITPYAVRCCSSPAPRTTPCLRP